METQGPVWLTFTHLYNLYSCEWAIWTEEKHSYKEGPVKKKRLRSWSSDSALAFDQVF